MYGTQGSKGLNVISMYLYMHVLTLKKIAILLAIAEVILILIFEFLYQIF